MWKRYLIKDTTREDRERIVRESLACAGDGCENCSACGVYGAGDPFDLYQPYIDGLKEIAEITREFSAKYLRGRGTASPTEDLVQLSLEHRTC